MIGGWGAIDDGTAMTVRPDAAFADPRLAVLYDLFEDDRDDLEVYAAMAVEFGARSVVDIGCGTGELAVRLARRGFDLVGVDPAEASLALARAKPGADRVRWVEGDATVLADSVPGPWADLAVMTGNVAQVFVTDAAWRRTLEAVAAVVRPAGRFVFETRPPAVRAWEEWTAEQTRSRTVLPSGEVVETWCDVLAVTDTPVTVTFRWTYLFEPDGPAPERRVSDSTLRFRERGEIERDLGAAGWSVTEVRDAPDRPGREWVFVTERSGAARIDG